MNPRGPTVSGPPRGSRRRVFALAVAIVTLLLCVSATEVLTSEQASAATPAPSCPPDCGKAAAGDPLLLPYMTVNPGYGWLALPDSAVQGYVDTLKRNLVRLQGKGGVTNVSAAKWAWINGRFSLSVVLVSSSSLSKVRLANPAQNAQDLCAASKGAPHGELSVIPGILGSVAGLCTFASGSTYKGATVASFVRANVAVLIEIDSESTNPIAPKTTEDVAHQQYLSLPSNGVLVSTNGLGLGLVALWVVILAAVLFCIVADIRRRGSWRGPFEAVANAFRRRKLALGVTLVAVAGAMVFSMVDASLLHGLGQWYESGYNDFWRSWATSAYTTYAGGYGHVYVLDGALETAPAWVILIAPISRLSFGLAFPDPNSVLYPVAYWVAGPVFLAAMALPICAGDRFMEYLGNIDTRRRLTVLAVMGITLPPIALFGHPEDLIALGAMIYGLIAALEGRHRAAGWWLGVALAFQFLAFLAIPIALLLIKRRQWLATIIPILGVPLSVMLVPLASDPSATIQQILHQKVYSDMGFISPTWNLDPGVGAFIRILVALAAIPAAFALARFLPEDRRSAATIVLWTLALLFALRVAEPELVPYFLAPALALFVITAVRGPWWRLLAASALAVWLNWWLHDPVEARWLEWLFLIGQLGALAWIAWPQTSPELVTSTAKPKKPIPSARKRPAPSKSRRRP